MKEDFIGLKIGSSYVTAARLIETAGNGLTLRQAAWAEHTADGMPHSSTRSVKKLLKKHPFHISTAVSNLRKASVVVRYFRYPMLSDEQLDDALNLEAEQLLLLPQDEICLDWHLNTPKKIAAGNNDQENAESLEGILIALPKKDMETELEALKAASLFPLAMRPSSIAVANLYLTQMGTTTVDADSICIVHSTPSRTELIFLFKGPSLYFSTATTRSGNRNDVLTHLNDALRDALWYFQFNLKKPEVQKVVFTRGLTLQNELMEGCRIAFPELECELWDPFDHLSIHNRCDIDVIRNNPELMAEMVTCLGLALG